MSILPETVDTLFTRCHVAAMTGHELSVIRDAALAVAEGKILWVGKRSELSPLDYEKPGKIIKCGNQWILPGFVDCHTHLVWGGSRSNEFEMRLNGVSYEQIASQGGGITATVKATRNATFEQLLTAASKRMHNMIRYGTTAFEIKSGYGLNLETEMKMLRVIDRLRQHFSVHISATFLGAHVIAPEFNTNPDGYITLLTETMLPEIKKQGIATAVDVFCEKMAFSREQTEIIFKKALRLGFKIKLHAEQLSDSDGTALAAGMGALSCDHLEYLSQKGIVKMAENKVVAVLLPGAFYYLKQAQKPPVQTLRSHHIPMAVSTDLNPGSSPVHSMPLILNMSCLLFDMTVEEVLVGATLNGAKALGIHTTKGSLEKGKDADLVVWDIDQPADLCYMTGTPPASLVMSKGKIIINQMSVQTDI